jgi:hypothetical protein
MVLFPVQALGFSHGWDGEAQIIRKGDAELTSVGFHH